MTFLDASMNVHLYIQILNEKVTPALIDLGSRGVSEEFLKKRKVGSVTWQRMPPDLNPTEPFFECFNIRDGVAEWQSI